MRTNHFILFLGMLMFANIMIGQTEICNNGIDDDGDGMIDLNDIDDCYCSGGSMVEIPSLIPNPSFEDYNCCPSTLSQLECAETWIQAGEATSDYFNTCDYTAGAPQPFPHGNAVTGMYFVEGWCEYVGACLLNPMTSGEDYLIRFNMSFIFADGSTIESVSGDPDLLSPVPITLYGSSSCDYLPFGGTSCPVGVGDWHVLGTVTVTPSNIHETWAVFEIAFNPDVDINSMAIGAPCDLPGNGMYDWNWAGGPYFLVDNLLLNSTSYFESQLNNNGNFCDNNIVLSLETDSVGTYQWYHEGIALVGETNETLDISTNNYPSGEYSLLFTHDGNCEIYHTTVDEVNISVNDLADVTVCNSYNLPPINGTNLGTNTNYYTQPNGGGEIVVSPVVNSQIVYIYSSTGSCFDQESVQITILQNVDLADIPDQSTCGFYTLPEIEGVNLTGNEAFYNGPGGTGGIISSAITESQTVYIFDNSSCSDEEEFTVSLTPEPQINPIISDTVCNFYNLPNITGSNLSGTENYYSEPNGQGEILTSPITSSQTVYIYDQVNSCNDQEIFQITVLNELIAYAGEDLFSCNDTVQLDASLHYPFTIGEWTGTGNFSDPHNPNSLVSSNYGAHQFVWRESFNACYGLDTVTVYFLEHPSPFISEQFDSVCSNTCNLSVLNANFDGYWTAYTGNPPQILTPAPFYSPSISSPNVSVTIGNFSSNLSDVTFIWTETNQISGMSCSAEAQKQVCFLKQPIASVGAINEAEICGNCYTELSASTVGSSYAQGLWISPVANCDFVNQNAPQAEIYLNEPGIFGDSAHVRIPVLWSMSNYSCTDLDTMWLTFYQRPIASAGLDDAVCGLNTNVHAFFDLSAHNGLEPTGSWALGSGPAGEPAHFSDIYDPNSNLNVGAVGIWEFIFRENNYLLNSCYDTDTVLIEFVETPIISAGPDMEVCGNSATLNAVSGGFTGTWLPVPGIVYDNYSNPQTHINGIPGTTYTLTWLESNQATTSTLSCSAIDEMLLTIWKEPTANILTDAEDNHTCGRRFDNLRAEIPGTGIRGYWYDTNPGTIYGQYDSVSTWVEVYDHGCFDFYWIEESGPELNPGFCTDTAGPLNICFIEVPTANAGNDTLFCGLLGSLDAIPSVGTGVWTTPSYENIEIIDSNNPNSDIISNVYNTDEESEDHFTLLWTEDNGNGCTDTDEVEVVFARIPQSETTVIPPKCFGEEATIAAQDVDLTQYSWNFYSGNVNSWLENTSGGTFLNMVSWDDDEESHIFSLFTTNIWGCQSPINIDTITEPTIPTFDYITIQDTCLMGKGGFEFAETENNSFFWLDTIYGPPSGSSFTTVYDIPAGSYSIRNSYLTSNIEHYSYYISTFGTANCVDTVVYDIEPIGLINAEISVSADIIMETLVAPNASVIFLNTSDYDDISKRCEWHFDDETILKSCDELVEHVYTKAGCYNPFLIVMNRDLPECRDTAYLEACVFIDNASKLEIPNIFSPNADGNNDYFQVKAQSLRNFSGIIVNRWGRTIFEWTNWQDYESGWDGKINGKSDASPGVYFYIIQAEGLDGTIFNENGTVNLMRE